MPEKIPVLYDAEVVVAGGGPSGVAAAASAARNGAEVVLLERYGFLGGMATMGLVNPFMTFFAGGKQIIHGVFQELLEKLEDAGGWGGENRELSFDAEAMKHVCEALCQEVGVEIAYHSLICGAKVRQSKAQRPGKRISSVLLANKGGDLPSYNLAYVNCCGSADSGTAPDMFWQPNYLPDEWVDDQDGTCYFGWHSYAYTSADYAKYTETFFDSLYAGSTALQAKAAAELLTGIENGRLFHDAQNFRLHWPHGCSGPRP